MSKTEVRLKMPEHVILYVGLNKAKAWEAVLLARLEKAEVSYTNETVTGSRGTIRHYTVIAVGPDRGALERLWKQVNG